MGGIDRVIYLVPVNTYLPEDTAGEEFSKDRCRLKFLTDTRRIIENWKFIFFLPVSRMVLFL